MTRHLILIGLPGSGKTTVGPVTVRVVSSPAERSTVGCSLAMDGVGRKVTVPGKL